MKSMTLYLLSFILLGFGGQPSGPEVAVVEKPNVLFIAVDDLRPELVCYGQSYIHSPHLDQLAQEGVLFRRAYCNIPVCGASRASLLTGTRPTRNRFLGYNTWAEKDYPEAITLPQHFRNNGYHTISNGKIFHHQTDSEDSWDEIWRPSGLGSWRDYLLAENLALDTEEGQRGPAYEKAEVADSAYFDGKIANKTIEDLKKLKAQGKPFFLATGFLKPHLPFNAPIRYWDMYDRDSITLPDNYYAPKNAPKAAIHDWGELRNYYNIPKEGPLSDSMALTLIHGYYACVSYTDAQIGKVLDALEELGLKDNTIVVLWGDHGWNLGEHTLWCKHANFNTSLQAPLLMAGPNISPGKKVDALVEFVDIYPTLNELAGLPLPSDQLEGTSMLPLIKDASTDTAWKEQVVSKYHDGVSIKTDRYLYTEWSNPDSVYARMLYDHRKDPEENVNIAEKSENQPLVNQLQNQLHRHRGEDFNQ